MASRPNFYVGGHSYDDTGADAINYTQSSCNTRQRNDVPRQSRSFVVQPNTDYQHLQYNGMIGNRLERVSSSQDCCNRTLTTPSNSCSSRANTDNRVLSNSAQHPSEASPRSRSHQLVTIERHIDDCICMFSRMKRKLRAVTGNSNIRKHKQEMYNNGLGRAESVPNLTTEYSFPDMVHDLAMLKGCIKALKNELKSTPTLKNSDDYKSDEIVPDVEISERRIEINVTCNNDTPSASCRSSHSQTQTRLKRVGCVSVAPEITTINFDIGSAHVETIYDKRILQAAENILLAKIDWSKDTQMKVLQAEKRKLERKMEKIACKKKLVEERIKEEHKMVERFVLRLEDRDHTLEDILDQIKEGALTYVVKRLLRDYNVRVLAVDCGLNFLLETTTGEDSQLKLDDVVNILGCLLPARKRNDAVWENKGRWNYGLKPIPDLGMKSPLLENSFYQVSGKNDDYDEESLHPDYPSESETSQERIEWEFPRNASQSEKRLTATRAQGSVEVLRARRINSTPATHTRVSDGFMPLQSDPNARYTFNRGEEMRMSKKSWSAPNITVEYNDGVSVHSVFIGDTSYSHLNMNNEDDNDRLPARTSSSRSLHIKIREREACRSISDDPEMDYEYHEYPKLREKKSVWRKIKVSGCRLHSTQGLFDIPIIRVYTMKQLGHFEFVNRGTLNTYTVVDYLPLTRAFKRRK